MITYKNKYGEQHELTVTELKQKLTELEEQGYGNYIVNVGYDSNFAYTSVGNEEPIIDNEEKEIFFDTERW